MKLLFLQGESNHDVLGRFTQSLSSAFTPFGQSDIFTLTRDVPLVTQLSQLIGQLLDNRYDAIVSFNALGADFWFPIDGKRMNVIALANIPHVCWMVDAPIYHIERLAVPNSKRRVIFTSTQHIQFAQDVNFTGQFYQQLVSSSVQSTFIPHDERPYDIAVAASWMGEPEPFWQNYPSRLQDITQKLLALMATHSGYSAYSALGRMAETEDVCFEDEQEMQTLLVDAQSYQRQLARIQLIGDVIESGLSVIVIGSGWQSKFTQAQHVTYIDSVGYEDLPSYYQQARVVVNMNAENGACERAFDAIACGAVVFSDASHALSELFPMGNGVVFYDHTDREASIAHLKSIIQQQHTETLAFKAQQIALASQQWEHRGEFLYRLLA